MAETMSFRGPDGDGVWVSDDGQTGLAHRRLAIVDLSEAGRQPMGNADGSIQVTFNGEIYNFPKLRRELEAKGHRFRSQSDTEVLVYLYEEMGDEMVECLDGDFAFGLWDDRHKRLLLARDRAGVHPVYYTEANGQFMFASEIKALLQHPDVAAEIDEEALYHYLTYLVAPAPLTLFRNICKLPVASTLVVQQGANGGNRLTRKYWEPFPGQIELCHSDLDGQLAELLNRSVKKRLMSDVPVGVLFSGGVDSTLNAVLFREMIQPEQVRTYHVSMAQSKGYEEDTHIAREMANKIGTQHHEISINEDDLINVIRDLAYYQDEPLADPVSVPLYCVTKLARETGTIVLHAGEGADEIFCGYDGYRRFLRHYAKLWKPLSSKPLARTVGPLGFRLLRHSATPLHRKMADVLLRLSRGQQLFMSAAVGYYESEKISILSPEFRQECRQWDSFDIVKPLYDRIESELPEATFLQKMTFIELQLRLPELLLMRVDKPAMANSVEVRVPFLDMDLVNFALSVPESFKLRDGISKEPLKRLAAQYVGSEDIYRPKKGFGVPIQQWFQTNLGNDMFELVNDHRSHLEQHFDVDAIVNKLKSEIKTTNQAFQLYNIYLFVLWAARYIY